MIADDESEDDGEPVTTEDGVVGEAAAAASRNWSVHLRYRPLLLASYVGARELLVVENPWLKVVSELPDPIYRPRYGRERRQPRDGRGRAARSGHPPSL